MATTETVEAGSYGRNLVLSTGTDLSIFDDLEAIVFTPGESVAIVWTMAAVSPGAGPGDPDFGKIYRTIAAGELDEVGNYRIHARLTRTTPPLRVYGDLATLRVVRQGEKIY